MLVPDGDDPPICPRSTQRRAGTPGPVSAGDHLNAILLVDTFQPMPCASSGARDRRLLPGQRVLESLTGGSVYDYGAVLRRQSGAGSVIGLELPSFMRSATTPPPRHLVLPSKRQVLSLPSDQLGARVGSYRIVLDPQRRHPTEHVGRRPESLTDPVFIAPRMVAAADGPADGAVVKAYRVWGSLEAGYDDACTGVGKDAHDNGSFLRYRALFLLYGHGNAIRDHKNKWSLPPVCQDSARKKVAAGGRRAAASSSRASRAWHQAQTAQ
ncbi:MAG: hypothetical protein M1826_000254 [Phylliscum demangeonii]|nr:MAG: hypothetical protein M1826_000254 [Phylliscum demangeonii]